MTYAGSRRVADPQPCLGLLRVPAARSWRSWAQRLRQEHLAHLIAGPIDRPRRIALTEEVTPRQGTLIAFQQPVLYPWLRCVSECRFGLKIAGQLGKAEEAASPPGFGDNVTKVLRSLPAL
jgi:hypothetical protein